MNRGIKERKFVKQGMKIEKLRVYQGWIHCFNGLWGEKLVYGYHLSRPRVLYIHCAYV